MRHFGIGFPLDLHPGGFLELKRDGELVRDSIKQILGTSPGERFFVPEFGARLRALLFSFNDLDEDLEALFSFRISDAIERWDPRYRVRALTFDRSLDLAESGAVVVDVEIVDASTGETETVRVEVRRGAANTITQEAAT